MLFHSDVLNCEHFIMVLLLYPFLPLKCLTFRHEATFDLKCFKA